MAFSLNSLPRVKQIKTKTGEDKRKLIANCFVVIKTQEKITDTLRKALEDYLTIRVKNMSTTNLSEELLKDNIKELLEFCCNKDYEDITNEDVIKHEHEMIQHIKWCSEYKNTKRLIFNEDEYEVYSKDSREIGTLKLI